MRRHSRWMLAWGAVALSTLGAPRPGGADGTLMHCDETLPGQIDTPGGSARFHLDFTAIDENIEIAVTRTAGNLSPLWMLRDGSGKNITPDFCGGGFAKEGAAGCGPLPATGNPYHVDVVDLPGTGTGTFQIHVQRLDAARACEERPACAIDPGPETDLLSFSASNGQIVRVNLIVTSSNFFPRWALLDGRGNNVTPFLCGGGFAKDVPADCGPLDAAAGPYRVGVADVQHAHTGSYLVTVDGTSLCCGNQALDVAEPCDPSVPGSEPQACCTGRCGFVPAGTVCRASAGICDAAENCPGNGPNCPADGFQPTTTVCRPSAGVCDVAENCSGSGL